MFRAVFVHVRAQWMGALALLLVIAGGTAYAANTISSSDVIDESLLSQDLKNGEVKQTDIASNAVATGKIANNQIFSSDVRDDNLGDGGLGGVDIANDSLTGVDVAESTLQNVDARRVGGLQARKINFQVPYGTGPTTVLDLVGLRITAECQNFGDFLDVKAFTSKADASSYYVGIAGNPDDTDTIRSVGGGANPEGRFDIGDAIQLDDVTPGGQGTGDIATGTLHYSHPDGSVAVVHLAFDIPEGGGCALTGFAIGG